MKLKTRLFAAVTATLTVLLLATASGARAADVHGLTVTSTNHFGVSSLQLSRLEKRSMTKSKTTFTYYLWAITGVSCALHDDCEAIGWSARLRFNMRSKTVQAVAVAFAEHWNGTRWSTQRVVNPGRAAELMSISCYAPNNCTAVGAYGGSFLGTARTEPMIEHWNGVRWRQVPIGAPKAKNSQDVIYSISCTVFGQCTALAGIESLKTGRVRAYSERFDGLRWSRAGAPNRNGGIASDISCPQWGDCFALSGNLLGVEHEQNNRWSYQKFALPNKAMFVGFIALSCGSTNDCVASGLYASIKGSGRKLRITGGPLVEHFNGKRWSRMQLPKSAYDSGDFSDAPVSCSSAGHCVVTGDAAKRGFATMVLENGKWRVVSVGANQAQAISCPDFDYCVAADFSEIIDETPTFTNTSRLNLADSTGAIFNGRRWRPVEMPMPTFSLRFTLK